MITYHASDERIQDSSMNVHNFQNKIPTKLTPWSRVLPEKVKHPKLLKKLPASYGNRRFITVFTTACHLSLS
jgi:hypothetical protein